MPTTMRAASKTRAVTKPSAAPSVAARQASPYAPAQAAPAAAELEAEAGALLPDKEVLSVPLLDLKPQYQALKAEMLAAIER